MDHTADAPGGGNNRAALLGELWEVIRLSLPIIITMSSHTLMQFADTLMLGRFGREELAASTPAGLTFFTIGAFMIGLVSANNTFVSQSLGRGQLAECANYTRHALLLGVAAQVLIVPAIIGAPLIFSWFGHETAVQQLETAYFRLLSLRLAGMSFLVALSTFFQATGRPGVPMVTGITANVVNIIGNYALIFGKLGFPAMGIMGAGLMTTLATYLEVALLGAAFLAGPVHEKFQTRNWGRFEAKRLGQLLRIGVGSGVHYGLDLASWTIFIAMVVGKLGETVLAGNNAASGIMHLSFMPAVGLNIGVTALVGRHIGMGDIPGAKRRAYLAMAAACAYMTLMGIIFFVFREELIGLFRKEPEVIRPGAIILTYVALFQFADAIGILSSGALKGAGDTRFPAIVQIVLAWGFFLPLVFYFGREDVWGIHGAWLTATVYIWIFDVVLFWRFRSERWRKINIFD